MMKAVIYARVSGDDSKYATSGIQSQLEDCRKFCADKGYEVIGEFYEEPNRSTSGADWLPEIENIVALAKQGAFSVLVVREMDRLSRNEYKQLSIENEFEYAGVRIDYVIGQYPQGVEGVIPRAVARGVAEYERLKTAERTTRGRVRSVNDGNVIIGACLPFGYDVATVKGKRQFVIDESEAAVVRHMFDLYASGYSLQGIVDYFAEHNIPKPGVSEKRQAHGERVRKGNWCGGTISNMLKNETYVGRWYYRKTKPVKVPGGKVKNVPRPREEWLMVEVPAIVDTAVFGEVQRRKKKNKKIIGKQHSYFYLLGGMCKCGLCGKSMSGVNKVVKSGNYPRYVCNARHTPKRFGYKCDLPHFQDYETELVIWMWVRGFLVDPDALTEAIEDYRQNANIGNAPLMNMIDANKRKARELEKEKDRLIKAYAKGVLSLDEIAEEKTDIENGLRDLNQAISQLEKELDSQMLTDDDIASIQEMAAAVREEIDIIDNDKEAQREILLILDFSATFLVENGEKFIDVSCILDRDRLSASQATCVRGQPANHPLF